MALQSSGAISLAQVNTALLYASNASISLGSAAVRKFFQTPSGAISLSNGYGKYSVFTLSGHSHSGTHGGYNFAIWGGSGTMTCTGNTVVSVILMGGGGAGGGAGGGGGGSGGVHENNYTLEGAYTYGIAVGSGGTAVAPPITGVPTNGTISYIYRTADNAIIAETGGGGRGGTRNSSYRNGGSPTGSAGGGGGSSYAASSGGSGTQSGGAGVAYYGGGGGGARSIGGAGLSPYGGNGGFSYSFPSSSGFGVRPQWTVNSSSATQVIELGGGGGGSGWTGSGGNGASAGSGVFTTASPSGARYLNKDNAYQYYGGSGLRTPNESFATATSVKGGMGGGGGAYSGTDGTVGNANYRLGGNGSAGLVVVRWAQ